MCRSEGGGEKETILGGLMRSGVLRIVSQFLVLILLLMCCVLMQSRSLAPYSLL